MEQMWQLKAKIVPLLIGVFGALTPKLEKWVQLISGKAFEVSVQKSTVKGTRPQRRLGKRFYMSL